MSKSKYKLLTFPKGGVHPPENKLTADKPIENFPIPKRAYILVQQHIGAPANILVKPRDRVKTGQLIAEAQGFVSANIHSSVTGTVFKIDQVFDSSGYRKTAIVINTEPEDEWIDGVDLSDELKTDVDKFSAQEILDKIKQAGIVGLGGATFPSHVKLSIPHGKKCEYLIINGVECEPYLTADHRLMLEKTEEILVGVQLLMKVLNVNRAVIGIEANKMDAIEKMDQAAKKYQGITVQALKVKYPQGSEKQLIKAITGREVPSGGLPIDVGVVVHNVGTTFAVYEAVMKNKPLIERIVTVTGKDLEKPGNFRVRLGTPVKELIDAAGGLPESTGKVVMGGPMMGRALRSLDVPIAKGSSGVLLLRRSETKRHEIQPCIRCARCVAACPQGLEPYLIMQLAQQGLWDKAEEHHAQDCIMCGSCSYVCPSNRPLQDYTQYARNTVMSIIKARAMKK